MIPEPVNAAESSQVSLAFLLLSDAAILLPLFMLAGFFSGTETALLSLSRPRREALRFSTGPRLLSV